MYIKHTHTTLINEKNPISSNKPKRQDDAYTVYKQCKKSTSDRCPIHVFQLRTVCTRHMHGPAADLGVNLRDEVKQKAWGSLGGGGAEGRGRGGMLIRERWRDRDYCALLYSTWLEKRSTPSILNPPVQHTNTQTAHREQQIDTFFLIKGKGSGLCAMPAHSKH